MSEARGAGVVGPVGGGPASGQFLAALQSITQSVNSEAAALTALVSATATRNWVAAPAHNTSAGVAGQIAYDSGFFYVCFATNSWGRIAIGGTW